MSKDHEHKTLEYMTTHFSNVKLMSPALFYTSVTDLSIMANGGDLKGLRDVLYPCDFHTDSFFIKLLYELGYDADGFPLDI